MLVLVALICSITTLVAFGAGLEVTGSGYYGLSPSEGPFGRTVLSPQVTQIAPVATVRLIANGDRHETVGWQYVATLAGEGTAAYGAFTARMSFELQARPQTLTYLGNVLTNGGHSELEAHMNLKFSDSGVVTSSTLPGGTPVTLTFKVANRTSTFISEPVSLANSGNPYPNGNFAGLDANGNLTVFDETSLAEINGALFQPNQVSSFTFNTAVGHRIDLSVNNFPAAYGYAGYIGLIGSQLSLLFYADVQGTLDSTTDVSLQAPPGVGFQADSGHSYAPANAGAHSLGNISTRGNVGTGDNVMIGGLVVRGTSPKQVIIRALGPTLGKTPFNVPGALANPILELHAADGHLIVANDNWANATNVTQVTASGLAPPNPAEAAILTTLAPGSYTAIVRGSGNTTGIALMEVYDLEDSSMSYLANISTRGFVQTGDKVMIAGLVVKGLSSQEVILRGLGPTLGQAPFNVPNVLANPFLDLRNAQGTRITANDDWQTTQKSAIQASGYAPAHSAESAIMATLAPGNYTAILSGVNSSTGNALVEVYALN